MAAIINVRDNEFEPEGWAWNLHFHHNRLHNIHKQFSIDDVQGGPIYIYGNVTTQDDDEYTKKIVSGIYKFKDGPLTDNCYVFNNSFYTEARVMKEGEAINRNMKHFNNAYYFFSGSDRFQLSGWHGSFEFDYDAINQNWPPNIINNNQEQHGIITEKVFVDPENGNLQLHPESPCIDAGKIMELPELDYIQPFKGKGVDIGAYEGEEIITGPAFR